MRMRWNSRVACRGRGETPTRFWWGNLREKEQLKDQSLYERIILKLMLKKSDGTAWTVLLWPRIAASGGPL
jgi:hypothetical protein